MTEHTLRLHKDPFDLIASGNKTIEARLYDEKRQAIQVGDMLVFVSREDPAQIIKARVTDLLGYKTFAEMFQANDPHKFGGLSAEWLLEQINQFYSYDDQQKNGVVGIQFKLI